MASIPTMAANSAPTFDEVYEDHHRHVARYLNRRCDHLAELEDVLQETFIVAWQNLARQAPENIRSWLIGIAKRVQWSMRRAMFSRTPGHAVEYNVFEDKREAPENQELATYVAQLREKFGCLGPAQAAVMHAIADGSTAAEIAKERGTSHQAATLSINLARKNLIKMETS